MQYSSSLRTLRLNKNKPLNTPEIIEKILAMNTIAVVGLSPRTDCPSHGVARYLLAYGYHIIPVNPAYEKILGLKCYPSLKDIPEPVEVVDVFRRAEHALPVAEEAVAIGARALWLQLGIVHDEAVRLAEAAGLLAVQNRCIKIEHMRRGVDKGMRNRQACPEHSRRGRQGRCERIEN